MDKHYIARALSLRLGKRRVIDSVSLTLRPGEVTALIGPNGAGKSTLLRLLTGFLAADSGEQRIEGKPTHDRGEATAIRHHDNGKRQNAHLGEQALHKRHLHVDRRQNRKRRTRIKMARCSVGRRRRLRLRYRVQGQRRTHRKSHAIIVLLPTS